MRYKDFKDSLTKTDREPPSDFEVWTARLILICLVVGMLLKLLG